MSADQSAPRLCRDCKWIRRSWFPAFWDPYQFAKCGNPLASTRPKDDALVSGRGGWFAATLRGSEVPGDCGRAAIHFEVSP